MKFDNIHSDTDCRCISSKCVENTEDVFCHALRSADVTENDFRSLWEDGRYGQQHVPCSETCERKGVSINILTTENEAAIKMKYAGIVTQKFKPRQRRFTHYCTFKFVAGCGKVLHTPRNDDPYHYTFFKCDAFKIEQLSLLSTQSL